MTLYALALFFHVVGALGFFIALGLEWFCLMQLQRTSTVEQVVDWFDVTKRLRGIAGISMLVILIAGFYMTFAAWGGADWIEVAFGAIIVQGVIAGILTSPRMRALQKAIADAHGPLSTETDALIHHPLLWVSMWSRIGIALGIIFLMTVKPALVMSLIVIGVGAVAGVALALITMGGRRGEAVVA